MSERLSIRRAREAAGRLSGPDVHALGQIAIALRSDELLASCENVADILRAHAGADVCEVFFADVDERSLFLAIHRGPDAGAFLEQDRFDIGVGLPGLLLGDPSLLVSQDLSRDPDFVRQRVRSLDYHGSICAPILSGDLVAGALFLAWKGPRAAAEQWVGVAEATSHLLGTAIAATRDRITGLLTAPLAHTEAFDALAGELRRIAAADTARVSSRIIGRGGGVVSGADNAAPLIPVEGECPALRTNQTLLLQSPAELPPFCLAAACLGTLTCCQQVATRGNGAIVVSLSASEDRGRPPLRFLPVVHMLRVAADRLLPADPRDRAVSRQGSVEVVGAPPVVVRCFGGLRVEVDGRELGRQEFGRRKARELLALLVAHRGRPVAWDVLADLLWPEVDADSGRNRLHVTVHALRRALAGSTDRGSELIRRDQDAYRLDRVAGVSVDLWRLEELAQRLRVADALGRSPAQIAPMLEEMIALHSGDLLADGPDVSCVQETREWARRTAVRAALDLARISVDLGRPEAAIEALAHAVQFDPYREDVQARLIDLLDRVGRRASAIEHYRALERLLEDELGVEPGSEVRSIGRRIGAAGAGVPGR